MITAEQLARRQHGLGASDAAAVLGISKYRSPLRVWAEKTGKVRPTVLTWDMRRGSAMEPELLGWYAEQFGAKLTKSPDTLYHPEHFRIFAHLDATAELGADRWVVEAKDIKYADAWGPPGSAEVDPEYLPQGIVEMECAQLPWVDFVVSVGGHIPDVWRVHRDERRGARLCAALAAWWDRHVEADVPPPPGGSDDARQILSELYRNAERVWLTATPEMEEAAVERRSILQQIEPLERRKSEIENEFRAIVGGAYGVKGDFGRYLLTIPKNGGSRAQRWSYAGQQEEK